MHSRIREVVLLTVVSLLMVLCCTTPVQMTGGSSSETVVGRVVNGDGSPACSTLVALYPDGYDPIADAARFTIPMDTTDSIGNYRIHAPDSSMDYSIVATNTDSGTLAMVTGIVVSGETTRAPDAVLARPGAVRVVAPETVAGGYVFIPGTGISIKVNGQSMILLGQVPAGTIPSLNYAFGSVPGVSRVLSTDIEVESGDTVVIPYLQWRDSATVYINTTATGAGVSGTVTDFPILVRLNSGNFDFTRARQDGADIRFAKKTGNFLAHEIERWDPVAARAEIWVRVDTVFGNDSTQALSMYWGNDIADAASNGAVVFDTATKFEGVWHLAEPENSLAYDATAHHYDGTPSDTAPAATPGAIGIAKEFNGVSNGIQMKGTAESTLNFSENGHYTVSAWVYADTSDDNWHFIAGKGNKQYYLKQQIKSRFEFWEFVGYLDRTGWQLTVTTMTQKTWKYLTGVRDGARQYFYLDGVLADSAIILNADTTARDTSEDVTIGRHQNFVEYADQGYCFYDGKIDEVRISSVARSADWIKLCFMNQREEDNVVVIK